MLKYLVLLIIFLANSVLFSQSNPKLSANKFNQRINRIVENTNIENHKSDRAFIMKYDTLFLLLAEHPSPGQLVTTIIVEYDDQKRVSSAKIINEDSEQSYIYVYHYQGSQLRFATMDYILVENNIETYDGYQTHIYNAQRKLVSSKEFTKNNELVYADSLNITYDNNNNILSYKYLFYQDGKWNTGRSIYDVKYTTGLLTEYATWEQETGAQGQDTLINYLYNDVVIYENKSAFLFKDINEFFETDSAGVDRFFLSREDGAQYFLTSPIAYKKYRIKSSGPNLLVESSEYESSTVLETIIKNGQGIQLYRITYKFDNDGKLNTLTKTEGGETTLSIIVDYNEHDRVSHILYQVDGDGYEESDTYRTDSKGRLVQYRQDVILDPLSSFSTILKFGYRGIASSINSVFQPLLISPNPAENYIIINNLSHNDNEFEYNIVGTSGSIVLSGKALASNKSIQLNINELIPGNYYLILNSANGRSVSQFVKQ